MVGDGDPAAPAEPHQAGVQDHRLTLRGQALQVHKIVNDLAKKLSYFNFLFLQSVKGKYTQLCNVFFLFSFSRLVLFYSDLLNFLLLCVKQYYYAWVWLLLTKCGQNELTPILK